MFPKCLQIVQVGWFLSRLFVVFVEHRMSALKCMSGLKCLLYFTVYVERSIIVALSLNFGWFSYKRASSSCSLKIIIKKRNWKNSTTSFPISWVRKSSTSRCKFFLCSLSFRKRPAALESPDACLLRSCDWTASFCFANWPYFIFVKNKLKLKWYLHESWPFLQALFVLFSKRAFLIRCRSLFPRAWIFLSSLIWDSPKLSS